VLKRLGLDCDWLRRSKYGADELRNALIDVFQDKTLGEAQNRLLMPSVNMTNGQTKVFKTPHLPNHFIDRHLRVADAVLATTAAPTYFPHAIIQEGSCYVDGGIWANNPGMAAFVESVRICKECTRQDIDPSFSLNETFMLSIGTGSTTFFASPPEDGAGVAWWASRLLDLISLSQSQGAHFQAAAILDKRYERVDFSMPEGRWALDNSEFVDQMIHNGRQKAAERFGALRRDFFLEPALEYQPFPEIQSRECGSV
jgi:hypothetical protein